MAKKQVTFRRGGRKGNRAGQQDARTVTLSRRDLLGSVPASTGGFIAGILAAYPAEATIAPIAQSYSEYRYTRYKLSLVPQASSSTLGNGFIGYQLAPPFAPADLAQCSALQGFKAGPAFGRNTMSLLDTRARSRRWFQVVQGTATEAQLINPDIVQAWPTVGSQNVQSGVVAWDIYVEYTIQFRGPLPATAALSPAFVTQMPHIGHVSRRLELEEDEQEDVGESSKAVVNVSFTDG
jgi:hypothetical protein